MFETDLVAKVVTIKTVTIGAWRSRVVRLSRTGAGVTLKRSCSTASKKVSSAASLWGGGVHVPLGRNGLGLV